MLIHYRKKRGMKNVRVERSERKLGERERERT